MALAHLADATHGTAPPFLTDGGLETVLVFLDGFDLPDFAAFPLLDDPDGTAALVRYYRSFLSIAEHHDRGMVLDTPTWRANAEWGARLGYGPEQLDEINQRAVDTVRGIAAEFPGVTTVVEGVIGPRGDGYVVDEAMSPEEAARYHAPQARSFAEAGADLLTILTATSSQEAAGVVRAGAEVGLPVAVSFTVETDGRLPSGQSLAEAIDRTDDEAVPPAYYMVNCAHPTHFEHLLDTAGSSPWSARLRGIRANASPKSHDELDEATELDRGDVADLARRYTELTDRLDLCVVGGCCGTDQVHIDAIARATVL